MKRNYIIYHLHTMLSNGIFIDSATNYKKYIAKAKELGMKAIAFSEHGNVFSWYNKKCACDDAGIKYIHGIETYLTETLDEKVNDNYHIGLYAKNWEGVKEINRLSSKAFNRSDGHYYYSPRISVDELMNTSDNVIITSACLGGVLSNGSIDLKKRIIKFFTENRHRVFLEIQHHNVKEQIEYNMLLWEISKVTNIPLIAGTDTHSLNGEYHEARAILQKSKGIHFDNEDAWDSVLKTYDELVQAYVKQGALPTEVFLEAIENTNRLADMVEDFKMDKTNKYPRIHANADEVFRKNIMDGYVTRGIDKLPTSIQQIYQDRVQMEYNVYKQTDTIDYMLFQKQITDYAHDNDMFQGYGRGSVNGSLIAYLLGITDMDSIKFELNFFRFLNPQRISLADIDLDWQEKDRIRIKEYIFKQKGLYSADIITFNTIALKGAIKDVARALNMSLGENQRIDADSITKDVETKEQEYREMYPQLFKYVDLLVGCIVSVGTHPSGTLISPIPIDENVGMCTLSTTEYPVTVLNMKELDNLNFVKLDILGLDNMGIINETCKLANIERLTPDNMDTNDWEVWKSIREDTTAIFQWESESASSYVRRLFSDETIKIIREMNPNISFINLFSFGNGAIRPSGNSFRYDASKGIFKDNGMEEINNYLASTMGYLLYQEQIMKFLNMFCGYSDAESDTVRRAIGKKTGTETLIPEIRQRFMEYSTTTYGIPVEKAETVIEPFIQIILDASNYGFSKNHSDPYSLIGYACGYLRYYYPLEFLTSAFNIYKGVTEKIARVTAYANKIGVTIKPIQFRYSKGEYMYDREGNCIYKGTESVKTLNINVGNELYELGKKQYDTFTNLLVDILENTSCNKTQVETLIMLDFFKEFGSSKKLLIVYTQFQNRYKKTHKDATKIKRVAELVAFESVTPNDNFTPDEKIKVEFEYLGYAETTIPSLTPDYCLVASIMTKFKNPVVTLYRLCDGQTANIKVKKSLYDENKFNVNDIIRIVDIKQEKKWKKTETGFVRVDEYENFLALWNIVR